MPLNVRRVRRWLLSAAALLITVVLGFLAVAQYRVRNLVRRLPQKVGIDIQQTASGFSFSKSEKGRTLFTIHASQMMQFKGGGKAELHDVNIIIYGKNSNRFDQIYGSGFEYDEQQKLIRATGEVHIDLQADTQGAQHPDQAPPQELKNPVHLKTSGLVFNQNTGMAETQEQIEFRTPQASGRAMGAVYNSHENTLTLLRDIRLETQAFLTAAKKPAKPRRRAQIQAAVITAAHAVLHSDNRTGVLQDVAASRGSENLRANTVTVRLRDDSSIETLVASGDVRASDRGASHSEFQAQRAEFSLNSRSMLERAVISGGATYQSAGARPVHGAAGRVLVSFGPRNTIASVKALDGVDLVQEPGDGGATASADDKRSASLLAGSAQQRFELKAPQLDLIARDDRSLERAFTAGASELTITDFALGRRPSAAAVVLSQSSQPPKPTTADRRPTTSPPTNDQRPMTVTTISAGAFNATFDPQNRLQALHGAPDAKIVSAAPGQPDRITTSRELDVAFAPATNTIAGVAQSGEFHYVEGQRSATSDSAHYTARTELLALSGSPRYADAGLSLSADSLSLNRRSGEVRAQGEVKATYEAVATQQPARGGNGQGANAAPAGAMLSNSTSVHVTAASMIADRATGVAQFSGGARLWQNGNIVQAPTLEFNRERRSMLARGTSQQRVGTVFVQTSQSGRTTPVNVTAQSLSYVEAEQKARFDGGVEVHGADATLTADHMNIFLKPPQLAAVHPASAPAGPARVDRIVAEGHIVLTQPTRKATGGKLVFTAAEDKFTLTGGPPSIFDAEHGQITGDSLTLFGQGDRVLVQSRNKSQMVIQTRVTK